MGRWGDTERGRVKRMDMEKIGMMECWKNGKQKPE